MTDAMGAGSGRGVGIRLFVAGDEVVKKKFNEIRDSGNRMWAGVAAGAQPANLGMRAISATSNELQAGMQGLASRAGPLGSMLVGLGPISLGLAAALGGLAIAFGKAREAMNFADELSDTATAIGISAQALQEWRYIVEESGGDIAKTDGALAQFVQTLGKAQAGMKKPLKVFEELGFTEAEIDRVQDVDKFLQEVVKRLGEVGRTADQAGKAGRLGLSDMLPVIRNNADEIDNLRQEARDLGLVMEEDMIRRGAEAQREFEVLSRVIDMQLKQAFIDLGPVLVDLMKLLAATAKFAREVFDFFNTIENKSTATLTARADRFAQRNAEIIQQYGWNASRTGPDPRRASRFVIDTYNHNLGRMNQAGEVLGDRRDRNPLPAVPTLDLSGDTSAPRGGARSRGASSSASGLRATSLARSDIITAEELELARLTMAIETARIQQNEQLIAQLERELELRQLIASFIKQGMTAEQAQLAGETEQSLRDLGRLFNIDDFQNPQEAGKDFLQTAAEIEATNRAAYEAGREGFGRGFAAAILDTEAFLADMMQRAAQRGLETVGERLFDIIMQALSQAGQSGSTGSGWVEAGINFLMGGGRRAGGGPMRAGYRYSAAEDGRSEIGVFSGNGHMLSHDDSVRALQQAIGGAERRSSGPDRMHITTELKLPPGYLPDAALRRMLAQLHASAVQDGAAMAQQALPGRQLEHSLLKS